LLTKINKKKKKRTVVKDDGKFLQSNIWITFKHGVTDMK